MSRESVAEQLTSLAACFRYDLPELALAQYVKMLADVPADVMEEACAQALRTLTFFPMIAELLELCSLGPRVYGRHVPGVEATQQRLTFPALPPPDGPARWDGNLAMHPECAEEYARLSPRGKVVADQMMNVLRAKRGLPLVEIVKSVP
jgi:hypothetical protein